MTIDGQQLTLPENDNSQQAHSTATESYLCVCIYVIGQAREAKCGRLPASARENETGQNKPFSNPPPVKLPIFPPVAIRIALSLCMSNIRMPQWSANPVIEYEEARGEAVGKRGWTSQTWGHKDTADKILNALFGFV